jgi:RNA polymerase sigma factor (sigma-70 family)
VSYLLYECPILPEFDIEDDRANQEEQAIVNEYWRLIGANLSRLNPRQRYIIESRYLGEVKTLKQIAIELSISTQYVSKLEKQAILTLRKFINVR